MRSYGQLCAVARALDIVGDRWNLLIVRELLIHRKARFTDLQRGLPGIAPNLLTDRLRNLSRDGVVQHHAVVVQASRGVYRLTERGRALDGVIRELLKWGAPTVSEAPDDAAFQMHWLGMPAAHLLKDNEPSAPAATVRFGDLMDGFDARAHDGSVDIGPCNLDIEPTATISGPGRALVGLIQGGLPFGHATRAGIGVTGDSNAVRRVLPLTDWRPRIGGEEWVPKLSRYFGRAVASEAAGWRSIWRTITCRPRVRVGESAHPYDKPFRGTLTAFRALTLIEIPILDFITHPWPAAQFPLPALGILGVFTMTGILLAYYSRPHAVGPVFSRH